MAPGERKWQKSLIANTSISSIVVEYSSHQPKIKASSPAISTGKEEMATKCFIVEASISSIVVEHASHQPNIKVSSPAVGSCVGSGREEMATISLKV